MPETILNIYLVIEKDHIVSFRAKAYLAEGSDEEKIRFLKSNARNDFESAMEFESPKDKHGAAIPYRKFSKLERQGLQYKLFEEIFSYFDVPQNPLICVTPVVDSSILAE